MLEGTQTSREQSSKGLAKVLAIVFFCTTLALAGGLGYTWWYIRHLTLTLPIPEPPRIDKQEQAPAKTVSPLLLQYKLDVPGRGEIFPALSVAATADYWPVAILTIANSAEQPAMQVLRAEIPGYSRPLQQTLIVGPRDTVALKIAPELLPDAYRVTEISRASLSISVTDEAGTVSFAQSRPVLIHSGSDLYWGKQFANAQLVARWVTPHDDSVLRLVSTAQRHVPRGRMPGYNISERQDAKLNAQVRSQAKAVFQALKSSGFSYVSSIFTFGDYTSNAQRIRLPRETLTLDSANCIDISVAFASAIENIGMQPLIVIVPGHAFAGVRLGPGSVDVLYLDLTVLPNGSFEQAIARAQQWIKKIPAEQVLTVDVASARRMGVYPLPATAETSVGQ